MNKKHTYKKIEFVTKSNDIILKIEGIRLTNN